MKLSLSIIILIQIQLALCAKEIDFSKEILPILSDKCFACHGFDDHEKTDFKLITQKKATQKLESGLRGLEPGKINQSEVWQRIHDEDAPMPPSKSGKQLSEKEKALIKQWIEEGAEYQQHWSFKALSKSQKRGIDYWVEQKHKEKGLSFSNPASKEVLARRLSFDLTGLPLDENMRDRFFNNKNESSYEELIDDLMASPHFGEHMAKTWLDGSRYADSNGYNSNGYRVSWPWRDWVVKAYNDNMPYHTFLTLQLAGDLLPGATNREKLPTMFNRLHAINAEAGSIAEEFRIEYAADRVETMGTLFMGLTLNCARCHNHKYDPIKQNEYYQLMALFIDPAGEKPIFRKQSGRAQAQSPAIKLQAEDYKVYTEELQSCMSLVTKGSDLDLRLQGEMKIQKEGLEVMVMKQALKPKPVYVLKRGAYHSPDKNQPVQAGGIDVLGSWPHHAPKNRLGLATWLLSDKHPLTARVEVNRLWQNFFPKSLVRSPENFGIQGNHPTHPELLDELAKDFMDSGWDRKNLIKRIVMSRSYRQSSVISHHKDPENRYLSRQFRRRLSAEEIRDQSLALSGLLDKRIGGDPVRPWQPPELWKEMANTPRYELGKLVPMGIYIHGRKGDNTRRSLYALWNRNLPPPFMSIFDAPPRNQSQVLRNQTNTPQQALLTMNDPVHFQAAMTLGKIAMEKPGSSQDKLEWLHRRITGKKAHAKRLRLLHECLIDLKKGMHEEDAKTLLTGFSAQENQSEIAVWGLLSNTLLNLDASIVRD